MVTAQQPLPHIFERLPLARRALAFADERHAGQRREADGAPFVLHPLEVACLLDHGGHPEHVVAAGALHDVLEDTDTTVGELEERFGARVARLVEAVTDDPSIEDHAERKAALRLQVARASREALAVYAADKVSKARELRLRAARGRLDESTTAKRHHYEESLDLLDELLPGDELVDMLRGELTAAEALAAR
jgi:(p)ppGpp synthase/HD superfamily hydrolase